MHGLREPLETLGTHAGKLRVDDERRARRPDRGEECELAGGQVGMEPDEVAVLEVQVPRVRRLHVAAREPVRELTQLTAEVQGMEPLCVERNAIAHGAAELLAVRPQLERVLGDTLGALAQGRRLSCEGGPCRVESARRYCGEALLEQAPLKLSVSPHAAHGSVHPGASARPYGANDTAATTIASTNAIVISTAYNDGPWASGSGSIRPRCFR